MRLVLSQPSFFILAVSVPFDIEIKSMPVYILYYLRKIAANHAVDEGASHAHRTSSLLYIFPSADEYACNLFSKLEAN